MIKRALIIAAPLTKYDNGFVPGVSVDAENYRRYFRSSIGGGFYSNEVDVLINPFRHDVLSLIYTMDADYSVIVFSGHGAFSAKAKTTCLQLNSFGEELAVSELISNASKQLFIINCCRNVRNDNFYIEMGDIASPYLEFPSQLSVVEGRSLHDCAIADAEEGRTFLFSASIGESALTSDDGSHFCNALLTGAKNWSMWKKYNNVLNLLGAYRRAKYHLKHTFVSDQNPSIPNQKNWVNFPFAVRRGVKQQIPEITARIPQLHY